MITVRLKRLTNSQDTTYAIIVTKNSASPSSGKFLEKLGFYKPIADKWSNKYVYIDFDRLLYWLNRGVKINPSVYVLIKPLFICSLKTPE